MPSEARPSLTAIGGGDVPASARMLAGLLAERRSCRAFRPEPVPHAVIERMLAMAQMTPSWCNTQPWQVIVTERDATDRYRTRLLAHVVEDGPKLRPSAPDIAFPASYPGVYGERRREAGRQLYDSVGIARGDRIGAARQTLRNFELFDAPHMLLVTSDRKLGSYGAVDCGLYIGTLLLVAESLGLGMIAQAALAGHPSVARELFGIPDDRLIVVGASFGYADRSHAVNGFHSRRAPIAQAVRWASD